MSIRALIFLGSLLGTVIVLNGCAGPRACDPGETQPYQRAETGELLQPVEGLEVPRVSGLYQIRGASPEGQHVTNPCLREPPRIVPTPRERGEQEDAD